MIDVSKFVSGVAYKAAPSLKCSAGFSIDPVSAGAGVVSSLISGIMGNKAQKSANQTNIQIARETNAANKEMLESQQQFALDSWNRENEYNLPVNQVERLRAAGINPSAVFGNGSTSEAGSIDNPAASPMVGAQVQAEDAMAQGVQSAGHAIGNAINTYYQNQLLDSEKRNKDAQTANQQIRNKYEETQIKVELAARIQEMRNRHETHTIEYKTAVQEYNELVNTEFLRREALAGNNALNEAQRANVSQSTKLLMQQTEAQRIANQFAGSMSKAQIANLEAQTKKLIAELDLVAAQSAYYGNSAESVLDNAFDAHVKRLGIQVSPKDYAAFRKSVVGAALNSAQLQDMKSKVDTSLPGFGFSQFTGALQSLNPLGFFLMKKP